MAVDPRSGRTCDLVLNLVVRTTRPLQHVKTMIRSLDQVQRRPLPEISANGLEQIEPCQLIPGSL